jgi:UDP-2-acetamido-2-deoxy-ribo-hexuluronate aminotransferase
VRRLLADRGIETMVHYPLPLHLQPAYATLGIPEGTLPHAERACERALSLPLFPAMQTEQVEFVAAALREIVGRK